MKASFTQILLVLFILTCGSGYATTNSNQCACDFFDAADNSIEITDGRDKHGETSKSDKSNVIFDSAIGFIVASDKVFGSVFSANSEERSSKCA